MNDTIIQDQVTVQLSRCNCAGCGLTFAIPAYFKKQLRDNHKTFYCPSGHSNYYPQKSDTEIAREEAAQAKRSAAYHQERAAMLSANLTSERHKVAAERGAKTKLRKKLDRVKNGVCPCCHRSFQNLRRHMEAKHPSA